MTNFSSINKWKLVSIGLIAVMATGLVLPQAFAQGANSLLSLVTKINNTVTSIWSYTRNLPVDPASNYHIDTALKPLNQHSLTINQDVSGKGAFWDLSDQPVPANYLAYDSSFAIYSGHITLLYTSGSNGVSNQSGTDTPVSIICNPVLANSRYQPLATVDSANPIANVDFSCQDLELSAKGPTTATNHVNVAIEYTRICEPQPNPPPFEYYACQP